MSEPTFDVDKVAKLARLELNEDERKYLQENFGKILGYENSIASVEIDDEMAEKDESLQQIFREDKVSKSEVTPESFSPYIENKHFKVPKIIE